MTWSFVLEEKWAERGKSSESPDTTYVDHACFPAQNERLYDLNGEGSNGFHKHIATEGFFIGLEFKSQNGIEVDTKAAVLHTPDESH